MLMPNANKLCKCQIKYAMLKFSRFDLMISAFHLHLSQIRVTPLAVSNDYIYFVYLSICGYPNSRLADWLAKKDNAKIIG